MRSGHRSSRSGSRISRPDSLEMSEVAVSVGASTNNPHHMSAASGNTHDFTASGDGPDGSPHNNRAHIRIDSREPSRRSATQISEDYSDYGRRRFTLQFVDPAVEQRYCDFQYIDSRFIGGKLYAAVALFICVGVYFVFPEGGPNVGVFANPWWFALHFAVVSNIVLLACMFARRLFPYRELAYLLIVASHWPAFCTVVLFAKAPHANSYPYLLACFFFCCFRL